jgi:hypothetical protein
MFNIFCDTKSWFIDAAVPRLCHVALKLRRRRRRRRRRSGEIKARDYCHQSYE